MTVAAKRKALVRPGLHVGLLQICVAGVLWGTSGVVVTMLHDRDGLSAMTAGAWRMALGAAALIAFAVLACRLKPVFAIMRSRPGVAILVGCGTAAYQGLYFASVLLVGVSVATVVSLGLAPIVAAVWEHVAARSLPSWREIGVLAMALAGLTLISVTSGHGPSAGGNEAMLGVLLAVASGVMFGVCTALGHALATQADALALTTCTTAAGAVVLAPLFGIAILNNEPVLVSDVVSLTLLAYLGVATMAVSYGLLYAGLRTTSGSAATVATLIEPLSAALLAVMLLSERLSWPALAGGALILGAVIALRPSEEHPAPV